MSYQSHSSDLIGKGSSSSEKGDLFEEVEKAIEPDSHNFCFDKVSEHRSHATTFLLATGSNTHSLKYANQDAESFATAVSQQMNIPKEYQCLLKNVSKLEFKRALRKLEKLVTKEDRVIIYYSGHGARFSDGEAFLTYDVKGYPAKEIPLNLVLKDEYFRKLINRLKTDKILTVIDACHALGMYQNVEKCKQRKSVNTMDGLSALIPPNNKKHHVNGLFLAAATEQGIACESPDGGGVFTLKLLEVLKEGEVDVGKIFTETKQRVTDLISNQVPSMKGKIPFRLEPLE
jgi:hypothetical protein